MKKVLMFLFLFCALLCNAQTYKYIGVEDGLSSRRVSCIQKDKTGYMWFLTDEGVDRYDGKEFKHYGLTKEGEEVNSLQNLNWLYIDSKGDLWEIGKKGKIFKYEALNDKFRLVFQLPEKEMEADAVPVTYSFIDSRNNIWLCTNEGIFCYNTLTGTITEIPNEINEVITYIAEEDSAHYYIGTDKGVHYTELKDNRLNTCRKANLEKVNLFVNELYYHPSIKKLFIGAFQRGMFVYDINTDEVIQPDMGIRDISINCIKPLNEKEILIATDGAGIYKMNIETHEAKPHIVTDYNQVNTMNGNSINDIYIDEVKRIWMVNHPIGITVRDDRYSEYKWIKHSIGNSQSLINDQVHCIIEDSDGDLWFATSNGINLYDTQEKKWTSFLSSFDPPYGNNNHIYTALCEVEPGVIFAGGHNSGIYQITKRTKAINYLPLQSFNTENFRPDKYIRTIIKDSQGNVWSGGFYNLKRINIKDKEVKVYPGITSVSVITERDDNTLWIGTTEGLYIFYKNSGEFQKINLPVETSYIYTLHQTDNGILYIGTNGSGLIIYDEKNKSFECYEKDNCTLISNNIYTILSDGGNNIVLSTENSLTRYYPRSKEFYNWTHEQGLATNHFNPNSGVLSSSNNFIFGSCDGVLEFNKSIQLPRDYESKMLFSEFRVFYETVYPNSPDSPLKQSINETNELLLNYDQNIFSLKITSINYDYPSNILYSWKLEGFYDVWSEPSEDNVISFTNLSPGKYTLHVRTISNEDKRIVFEERNMDIIIKRPFWTTAWAVFIYAALLAAVGYILFHFVIMRRQRKDSDDKIQFFINTAHDIRTPLTLIKAPLEEIKDKEELSEEGLGNMNTAIRNVNVLLRLTTNLINFERMDLYSSELYISEYELNSFVGDIVKSYISYAEVKNISFNYENNFRFLNVWFDKEKMDSILKNIISNALKYTPENGRVEVIANETADTWSVEVKDTGIGVPLSEQKKLFKEHFRGSNAINSKVTGSGIGLILVHRLVQLHKGKITFTSVEHQGSSVKVTFPKGYNHFKKAHLALPYQDVYVSEEDDVAAPPTEMPVKKPSGGQRIMVVEDNDELRNYLHHTLSEDYTVQVCSNGKEALSFIKEYKPELVLSDIMMPEMRGDELCAILKSDIETSHIPVVLLTALNDEKNILKGLQTGADEYIIKPFNIGILKATLANLLNNRALLRQRFGKLDLDQSDEEVCTNCATDIDWQFIANVKKMVEENMDNPTFSIDVLCGMMNMSRTSLYNKIKALTDQAPSDYIRIIRLNKAAQLLKEGKYNITEIAEMTGFNDAKYFREVFKKHFNVSPSKYKG